jgi:hypothetical protein
MAVVAVHEAGSTNGEAVVVVLLTGQDKLREHLIHVGSTLL